MPGKSKAASTAKTADLQVEMAKWDKAVIQDLAGVEFLFSSRFADTLQKTAQVLALTYRITADEALDEFRRLLAIKVLTEDMDAQVVTPTTLSKFLSFVLPSLL